MISIRKFLNENGFDWENNKFNSAITIRLSNGRSVDILNKNSKRGYKVLYHRNDYLVKSEEYKTIKEVIEKINMIEV